MDELFPRIERATDREKVPVKPSDSDLPRHPCCIPVLMSRFYLLKTKY